MSTIDLSFEAAISELDQVVRDLEDGQIGLEQSLERYEKGVGLLKHCYGLLQQVEQRILVLTAVDENGHAVTKPFAAPAAEDESNGAAKVTPGRRAAKRAAEPEPDESDSELF